MSLIEQTARYYTQLVSEYDKSPYHLPFSEDAVASIIRKYQTALSGRDVLELACGTGFWTEQVAVTARSILAVDQDAGSINVVREKIASLPNASCQVGDAYTLDGIDGPFTGAFAQLWWSHVPKADLRAFLENLNSRLDPGSSVLFMDQLPYTWNRRMTDSGDYLEERTLHSGKRFEIIKNFPTEAEARDVLDGISSNFSYEAFEQDGYWIVSYDSYR